MRNRVKLSDAQHARADAIWNKPCPTCGAVPTEPCRPLPGDKLGYGADKFAADMHPVRLLVSPAMPFNFQAQHYDVGSIGDQHGDHQSENG